MRILLAVSGGIDSMYMANRASELFPEAHFAIAHCNFTLRGEESDGDEQFVRGWCADHEVECFVKRFDTEAYARDNGISIEMAARDLRYAWFHELCDEHGFDAVAVAHNANDNAETLILNLLRGTGARGMRGMTSHDGVVRPLLDITREQIRWWMEKHGCQWREDRTNAESSCRRNIVRNDIFPLFSSINPSFVKTLNADAARIAQADDIADDYFQSVRDGLTDEDGNIRLPKVMALRHWKYVLWRLLERSGIKSEEFAQLVGTLESGRQIGGKVYGPVRGVKKKLVISR